MSNHLVKAYKDGSGSSGTPLHSPQSCWMSRWTQAPSKQQGSLVAPHSQTFSTEESLDHKQKRLRTSLILSSDFPRSYGFTRNNTKAETVGLNVGSLTIKAENTPFCFLGDSRNTENACTRTPTDPSCSYVAKSPSSTHEKADPNLQPLSNAGKITVFKGNFSNNDFGSLDQGNGNREKYSAIVVHERSGFSPLLSNNQFEDLQISCQADAPSLRPVRNVEAMRICNAVDYAGNSNGRPPLYSKTTTHHVLFTSRTGVVPESTQHRGVKIQPLWSSTDSEKDNFGDAERSFDLSAETDAMDVVALLNKNDSSGLLYRPIDEITTTRDKTLLNSSVDPWEDKVRGKLLVTETPGTNSLDGVEPSTSRTQSLEAKHLLSCVEQPSESKPFPHFDECALQEEPSYSSEIGESSSHDKTQMIKTGSDAPSMDYKHQIKESFIPYQNAVPMMNGESSMRTKNPIFQSSWIQRWCQDGSPSKSVVVSESDTSKLPLDELEKKQLPSIAAVALMGKSVDGLHACKFTKRGPLVVWNSEDY